MYKAGVFMLFVAITLLSACKIVNPPIQVPSYIHIDQINVVTNYPSEGSNSSKITDAWVYVNDQYLGTYQLPATIPIVAEGNCKVSITAGIKINGIAANHSSYPFYSQFNQNIVLKQGEKINLIPSITYLQSLTSSSFSWKEDFESLGLSIKPGPGSDTTITKATTTSDIFEGSGAGVVYLDDTHSYFEGVSTSSFSLPTNGDAVYLELNYKTNNPFIVGLYAYGSTLPLPALGINPSTQWNKIYINLSSITQFAPSSSYQVFFRMNKDAGVTQPALFLDNIKLVHF